MTPTVYVHIPFCETKCPYCDFNSFAVQGRDVDGYLAALSEELDRRPPPPDPPTLFIGGGTPTVPRPEQIDRYLGDLLHRLRPDPAREFTVEANPGSLTAEKVAVLAAHGVNRVSLGAQSFLDRHLKTLGRVHSAAQIEEAFRLVRDGGIDNVNLDLIFAVPGLDLRDWLYTLDCAVALQPEHLSCYALIFEPGTEFHARRQRGLMHALDEEDELRMFRFTERRLRHAGWQRYEISAFARPGKQCRHNLGYWRNEPYAGYGAGAFSYLDGERCGNERHLERYARAVHERGDAFVSHERLEGSRAAAETIFLGLRTRYGVRLDSVGERHGIDAQREFAPVVTRLREQGLLRRGEPLRMTRRGWRVADTVSSAFL